MLLRMGCRQYKKAKIPLRKKHLLYAAIALAMLLLFGFALRSAGSWLVVEDELQPADAIVVLMGTPAYYLDTYGRSHRWYDRIFRVRDRFHSFQGRG